MLNVKQNGFTFQIGICGIQLPAPGLFIGNSEDAQYLHKYYFSIFCENNEEKQIMDKNLNISLLLDFYGELLTEKQREAIELYYDEDMSLSELAEQFGISRQGVRDSIKRGEALLFDMEEKLGLIARFNLLKKNNEKILELAGEVRKLNFEGICDNAISDRIDEVIALSRKGMKL